MAETKNSDSFTKESLLKAITKINESKEMRAIIEENRFTNDEVNKALCTEELVNHLNKNLKSLPIFEFRNNNLLGKLGECLSDIEKERELLSACCIVRNDSCVPDIFYRNISTGLTKFKACRVGSDGIGDATVTNSGGCFSETVTYLTSDGNYLMVDEFFVTCNELDEKNDILFLARHLHQQEQSKAFPFLNEIGEYIPDKYYEIYDI